MEKNFDKHGRDPRLIGLAAIPGLVAFVVTASVVLSAAAQKSASPTAIGTTVRW